MGDAPHGSCKSTSKYIGEQLFVGSDLSDADFAEIRDILFSGRGFDLDGYKDRCIKRRIAARIRNLGYRQASNFIERLKGNDKEQEELIEALTIHVSQFFRNPSMFSMLEDKILPQLLEKKRRNNDELRVWSVGCAGGEEPYSIALLFDELGRPTDKLTILGSDVSADILKKARAGLFGAHRLTEVPEPVIRKYFSSEGSCYRLDERICTQVRFHRHNILQDRPLPRADLILCRNMLIYFSRQEQEKILRSLAATLSRDGFLVLGRAETMVAECRELFTCIDPAEKIYQKQNKEIS